MSVNHILFVFALKEPFKYTVYRNVLILNFEWLTAMLTFSSYPFHYTNVRKKFDQSSISVFL